MLIPFPTPIFRFFHVDNLATILKRGALHAPNYAPQDGHPYKTIHNPDIQKKRARRSIPVSQRELARPSTRAARRGSQIAGQTADG